MSDKKLMKEPLLELPEPSPSDEATPILVTSLQPLKDASDKADTGRTSHVTDKSQESYISSQSTSDSDQCHIMCRILFCPLDILLWPCIQIFEAKCWENHSRYSHTDFVNVTVSVLATVIAASWSTVFVAIMEKIENESDLEETKGNITILITAIYAVVLYSIATVTMVVMYASRHIASHQSKFFVVVLGHLVGFGMKDLSYEIVSKYFSKKIGYLWGYFFLIVAISLLYLAVAARIRKHFCQLTIVSHLSKSVFSLSSAENIDDNEPIVSQRDVLRKGALEHEHDPNEEMEELREWMSEVDADIWQVASGIAMVELALFWAAGEYIAIERTSVGSELKEAYQAVGSSVFCQLSIFGSFVFLVSWFQREVDRYQTKLTTRSNEESGVAPPVTSDGEVLHAQTYTDRRQSLYRWGWQHREQIDRFAHFCDGLFGWSLGWNYVAVIFFLDTVGGRCIYACLITFVLVCGFWLRLACTNKRIRDWDSKASDIVKRREELLSIQEQDQNEQEQKQEQSDEEEEEDVEVEPLSSPLSQAQSQIQSVKKVFMRGNIDEMNILQLKSISKRAHRRLYTYLHQSRVFRKSYAIGLALAWESTLDLLIEDTLSKGHAVYWRLLVAGIITIVCSRLGFRLVTMEDTHGMYSNEVVCRRVLSEFRHTIIVTQKGDKSTLINTHH